MTTSLWYIIYYTIYTIQSFIGAHLDIVHIAVDDAEVVVVAVDDAYSS